MRLFHLSFIRASHATKIEFHSFVMGRRGASIGSRRRRQTALDGHLTAKTDHRPASAARERQDELFSLVKAMIES
ncbi:hypothetical protein [Amycolatopsis sp. WAC 04197]|uniref:hypothetical protein n=1 Tax=Amycolatopsis sp. WAC 04197 TaxID=2203199 RepID=UPI000F76E7D8|nr:hypothetical protein [Amycolatopsis sp. WAC 04197]